MEGLGTTLDKNQQTGIYTVHSGVYTVHSIHTHDTQILFAKLSKLLIDNLFLNKLTMQGKF